MAGGNRNSYLFELDKSSQAAIWRVIDSNCSGSMFPYDEIDASSVGFDSPICCVGGATQQYSKPDRREEWAAWDRACDLRDRVVSKIKSMKEQERAATKAMKKMLRQSKHAMLRPEVSLDEIA